jgi:hypothetical protein
MCGGKKSWDNTVDSVSDMGENAKSSVSDFFENTKSSGSDIVENTKNSLDDFALNTGSSLEDIGKNTWGSMVDAVNAGLGMMGELFDGGGGGDNGGGSSSSAGGTTPMPVFDPDSVSPTDVEGMRLAKLRKLRMGLVSTIKTTPLGLTSSSPAVFSPALSASGGKMKLGQ